MKTLAQALMVASMLNGCEVRPESESAANALVDAHDSDWIVIFIAARQKWFVRNLDTMKLYDPSVATPVD